MSKSGSHRGRRWNHRSSSRSVKIPIGAELLGADLADLAAQNLTQEQIATAHGNSRTLLPEGLTRPTSWDVVADRGLENAQSRLAARLLALKQKD